MDRRLVNTVEIAEYLGITEGKINKWVSEWAIPFVKLVDLTMFDLGKIDAWIEENSVEVLEDKPDVEKRIVKILDSTPPIKPCSKCSEVKAFDLFAIDKRNKDGRDSICKACRKKKRDEKVGKRRLSDKLHVVVEGESEEEKQPCNICGEEKRLDEFYKDKRLKRGRAYECKACLKAKAVEKWEEKKQAKKEAVEKAKEKEKEKEKVPWEFGGDCEILNSKGEIIFKNGKAYGKEGEEWLRRKQLLEEKENNAK